MYIIGVDGGGTKTKVIVYTLQGVLVGVKEVKQPSSIDTVSIKDSIRLICSMIKDVIISDSFKISSIFIGLGGIASIDDSSSVENEFKQWGFCSEDTIVCAKNDIYNAHASVLQNKPGIVIILGTGSVAFGVNENLESLRVGGYSFLEGDPGSSYYIGRQLLKTIAKNLDNRCKSTPLITAAKKKLEVDDYSQYVSLINTINRTDTASLAKIVTHYADEHDSNSLRIIDNASDEIMLMIKAIERTIHIITKRIVLIGSLGTADTLYKKTLHKKIVKHNKHYIISSSCEDPVYGSYLLAKQILIDKS